MKENALIKFPATKVACNFSLRYESQGDLVTLTVSSTLIVYFRTPFKKCQLQQIGFPGKLLPWHQRVSDPLKKLLYVHVRTHLLVEPLAPIQLRSGQLRFEKENEM